MIAPFPPCLTIIAWKTTHKQQRDRKQFRSSWKARHCLLQPNGWARFWPDVNFTEAKLPRKTIVTQIVLLFSKLQAFVVKGLVQTGLFPCNPPITPQIYANGKFFLYFSTLETNKQTKKHIYFFESFSKIFKKKNFELEMIQLGHLYSKNKVFSNMNTNFLDDEDDCNWYGDTGGGGGRGEGQHDERTRTGSHNISIREGHK